MMQSELNRLYSAWRRLGINFASQPTSEMGDLEPLILATAVVGGADERLTICAVSWLARYHPFVDGRRLSELTGAAEPHVRSFLGVMLSLSIEAPEEAGRAPQFEAALTHCRPCQRPRAMYDIIESTPVLRKWAQAHSLSFYSQWGLWHDDMTLKRNSIFSLAELLKVPELRARALCGPSVEASLIAQARVPAATAMSHQALQYNQRIKLDLLRREVQKGIDDVRRGKVVSADQAFVAYDKELEE